MIVPEKLKPFLENSYIEVCRECETCKGEGKVTGKPITIKSHTTPYLVAMIGCRDCFGTGLIRNKLTPSEFAQLATLCSANEHLKKEKKLTGVHIWST